jgi:hypothetical protein
LSIDDLISKLRQLGFLCHLASFDGFSKLLVEKPVTTPGNHIEGCRSWWSGDEIDGSPEIDGPSPHIMIEGGEISFDFFRRVPGGSDAYEKKLRSIDELYEELLHFWFDADSPMSKEEGFIPGPGRPPGA